jgi:hypothetical protein
MANHFVDSTTGVDDAGAADMDNAWASLDYALTSGVLSAGDIIWVRRIHSETPGSSIYPGYHGTPTAPIRVIGWPRAADASITQADWTNGSTTVDTIVGLSMDKEQHTGRYITAPDGKTYLLTYVTDSNTILIDREYAGPTVTATSGACTIQADEDYDLAQAIDDSGWTIDVAAWTADADDLPLIDFTATAFYLYTTARRDWRFHNLHIKGGTSFAIQGQDSKTLFYQGCLLEATGNAQCAYFNRTQVRLDRCILLGSGAGAAQVGFSINSGSNAYLSNSAIYGMGDLGVYIQQGSILYLDNVNIGVEVANGDNVIASIYDNNVVIGKGVILDTRGGDVIFTGTPSGNTFRFEDFGKVLGAHKQYTLQGTLTKLDVVAGSGDPYKRAAGADSVIEILFDESNTSSHMPSPDEPFAGLIFEHEFEASTDTKDYRYYVQAEGVVTATELWLECEYVSSHDDTTEYTLTKVESDEAFTARADAEDWAEYLEVTGITPAVASKVRIKLFCSYYHATNKIYVDPKVVITDG